MFSPRTVAWRCRGDVQQPNRASTLQDPLGSTAFMPGAHRCQTPRRPRDPRINGAQVTRNLDLRK